MKRKLTLAIALLLVVGAALWGVNYRLDHPPLTEADKEFRALVADADKVEFSQQSCQGGPCSANITLHYKPLDATQTQNFIQQFRLVRGVMPLKLSGVQTHLAISFFRKNQRLVTFTLWQDRRLGMMNSSKKSVWDFYELNPRFNKRLNRALDAYLPQRIRP